MLPFRVESQITPNFCRRLASAVAHVSSKASGTIAALGPLIKKSLVTPPLELASNTDAADGVRKPRPISSPVNARVIKVSN